MDRRSRGTSVRKYIKGLQLFVFVSMILPTSSIAGSFTITAPTQNSQVPFLATFTLQNTGTPLTASFTVAQQTGSYTRPLKATFAGASLSRITSGSSIVLPVLVFMPGS